MICEWRLPYGLGTPTRIYDAAKIPIVCYQAMKTGTTRTRASSHTRPCHEAHCQQQVGFCFDPSTIMSCGWTTASLPPCLCFHAKPRGLGWLRSSPPYRVRKRRGYTQYACRIRIATGAAEGPACQRTVPQYAVTSCREHAPRGGWKGDGILHCVP